MKRSIAIGMIALMFFTSTVRADKLLLILGQRYFLLDITGQAPTLEELTRIIREGADPVEPPPPIPAQTTRARVKALTDQLNDAGIASAVGQGAYATVRAQVESGNVNWNQAQFLITSATNFAVRRSEKQPAWNTWRNGVNKLKDDLEREGKLSTQAQQVKFLKEVEDGINDSVGNAAINLQWLIQFIRDIIQLILSLINTGNMENPEQHGSNTSQPDFSRKFYQLNGKVTYLE